MKIHQYYDNEKLWTVLSDEGNDLNVTGEPCRSLADLSGFVEQMLKVGAISRPDYVRLRKQIALEEAVEEAGRRG